MENGGSHNGWCHELEFVAFDVETTGLHPLTGRVLEIGAARFRGGTVVAEFEELFDPGLPIPPEASRVHGITEEDVVGCPSISDGLPRFLEFLGSPDSFLVGHYVTFDRDFVAVEARRANIPLTNHSILDSWALARTRMPLMGRYNLQSVASALRVQGAGCHRALADARVTGEVFWRLVAGEPPLDRDDLMRLGNASAWSCESDLTPPSTHEWEELDRAIQESVALTLIYDGGHYGLTPRRITPRGVRKLRGNDYLVAYCHIDDIEKTFRMDRVLSLTA